MSSLIVKTHEVASILPHPNADRLEIIHVDGWQTVVLKDEFMVGDLITYFPPDTLLPSNWIEAFGIEKYVQWPKYYPGMARIRCARLRGEPSFGLVVQAHPAAKPGMLVASWYGAEKYEAPVKEIEGAVEKDDARFARYTEIENIRNFPTIIREGEDVIISEKLDGSNVRLALIDGVRMAGSHKLNRKPIVDDNGRYLSKYWMPWAIPEVEALMEDLGKDYKHVILFGELFGAGIQSGSGNAYGRRRTDFAAFDLVVDGSYVTYDIFVHACTKFGITHVPILHEGPFSWDKMVEHAQGVSILDTKTRREGVVIRPKLEERFHASVGRVILKYISDDYLLSRKDSGH